MAAVPLLIQVALHRGSQVVVGTSVFLATMILVYFTSTLYHALPEGAAKQRVLRFDYGAIYLFIAGSYTPFALSVPSSVASNIRFGLVWILATGAIILKARGRLNHPLFSTGVYLALGWLVLIAASPLAAHMTGSTLQWLVTGGIAYTVGLVFFVVDARLPYAHFVWHIFVMAGTACHFFAVLLNTV
jgi:hemolysin III